MVVQATIETLQEATTSYPGSYDPTKINLSSLMTKIPGIGDSAYCGPIPVGMETPQQHINSSDAGITDVYNWSSTIDWIFCSGTLNNTNGMSLYTCNRTTGILTFVGYIIPTYPNSSQNVTDFRAAVYTHTEGTVAVSGTAVTGTSTTWVTDGMAVGARIGFGSTNPNNITTWYTISSIGSNTSITLTNNAGTVAGSTPYVIEEIRLVILSYCGTATNGGLFLIKGLNYSSFTASGNTIGTAVSTDNVQALYWLADAATVTNTTGIGGTLSPTSQSNTNHYYYSLNGRNISTISIYKYNIRASLTLSSGKDSGNSLVCNTGTYTTKNILGAYGRLMCFANTNHGPGKGVPCLYFLSTRETYRVIESNIIASSTTFVSDLFNVFLGGAPFMNDPTWANSSSIAYDSTLDRFCMGSLNSYPGPYTFYAYDPSTMLCDPILVNALDYQTKQSAYYSVLTNHLSAMFVTGTSNFVTASKGMFYFSLPCNSDIKTSTLTSVPLGAHWTYANSANNSYGTQTGQVIITPSISTSGATKFYNVFVNSVSNLGDPTWGMPPLAYRIYARTSGISGDTGGWVLLNSTGDLSALGASNSIQFKFEFKTAANFCIPARVLNLGVTYEVPVNIPTQYEWNLSDSNSSTGVLGFDQIATLGHTPTFTINYYRSDTGNNVLTATSSNSLGGTFYYYSSGWVAGVGPDTIGTRRQFVSSGLSTTNCYAVLSVV